jgi:hypothetical protein
MFGDRYWPQLLARSSFLSTLVISSNAVETIHELCYLQPRSQNILMLAFCPLGTS